MRSLWSTVLVIVAVVVLPGVVAALPTDILGNSPLLQMSEADKKLQYQAVVDVLEVRPPNGGLLAGCLKAGALCLVR
jgi:hypothetical protein